MTTGDLHGTKGIGVCSHRYVQKLTAATGFAARFNLAGNGGKSAGINC